MPLKQVVQKEMQKELDKLIKTDRILSRTGDSPLFNVYRRAAQVGVDYLKKEEPELFIFGKPNEVVQEMINNCLKSLEIKVVSKE
ncbi:MAG: hypothetical protein F4X82_03415 [Candidatus Spechtbacteria bacterium SB0662_bin_43]|uniref:Uncharacterized protein n=1 Tax=Candidatus Spechtbacteria bacterium SB0662_bin_43 TaxID=2604897 RepID=A0A845DK29_9BACT|nr:hypothetical protein [Candidatus Spechtbacteria bacterium SB0662_bin_43]